MADWAERCEIISRCMGEKDDAFINAYNKNIDLQTEEVIEGSDSDSYRPAREEISNEDLRSRNVIFRIIWISTCDK